MEKFGERIRELRKERGLTVYELATQLGVSRNTLTTWELGEKEPHAIELLREIAKILQVPLRSLLAGEKETRIEDALNNLNDRVTRLERIMRAHVK